MQVDQQLEHLQQILEKVNEMTLHGKEKLEEKQRQADEEARQRVAQYKAEWAALQDAIRMAFIEELRPFVMIDGAREGTPSKAPGDQRRMEAYIEIVGFAPIHVYVVRDDGGMWGQYKHKGNSGWDKYFFEIPIPSDDYEFGIGWNWRYGLEETNDLGEALAYAHKSGVERQQMEDRWRERLQAQSQREIKALTEPLYEPVDEHGGLMDELVALVRGIVDERLGTTGEGE